MDIYYAIDGTDNNDTNDIAPICYAPSAVMDVATSHVKAMNNVRGFTRNHYEPGTTDSVTGASSRDIIQRAMGWISGVYGDTKQDDKKLYLGGFSRGGAACIVIAHLLKEKGIPVQEMFLFDAVDRSFSMDNSHTATIPDTVKMAFHAMRSGDSGSRETFGNCGTESQGGNLQKAPFMTTHGGVGGWPNGQERVKPGLGSEDAAYITTHGLTRGIIAQKTDPRQKNIHEFAEPFPSNISVEQEIKGMKAAIGWMMGKAYSTSHYG